MQGREDFSSREEYEAPEKGYEPDYLLMDESEFWEVSDEDMADEKTGTDDLEQRGARFNDRDKKKDREKEKEMAKHNRDNYEDDEMEEFEVAEPEEIEDEEEEQSPRVGNKKGKGKQIVKKKSRIMLLGMILCVVLVLLGGGWIAMQMYSEPPKPTYSPQLKPGVRPQEKPASALPLVQGKAVAMAELKGGAAAIASEAMKNTSREPELTVTSEVPPMLERQVAATQPQPGVDNGKLEDIDRQIKELQKSLLDLRNAIEQMPASRTDPEKSVPKTILKDMTTEIQALSARNRTLEKELANARNTIAELRKPAQKKPERTPEKKKSAPSRTEAVASKGDTDSWEILGFSGNRVVVADERGTHSVNVGQSLNGVKILSVDVETGTVKTSAGSLKYGQ